MAKSVKRNRTWALYATADCPASTMKDCYRNMIRRCYDPTDIAYDRYGGRGVRVCREWLDDPILFAKWLKENKYQNGKQIDKEIRSTCDGMLYSPEDCTVVDPIENYRNRRSNKFLDIWGERKTVKEWAEDSRCCVPYKTFWNRIRAGWSPEEAMKRPSIEAKIRYQKETISLSQFLNIIDHKISRDAVRKRISRGHTAEQIEKSLKG